MCGNKIFFERMCQLMGRKHEVNNLDLWLSRSILLVHNAHLKMAAAAEVLNALWAYLYQYVYLINIGEKIVKNTGSNLSDFA